MGSSCDSCKSCVWVVVGVTVKPEDLGKDKDEGRQR